MAKDIYVLIACLIISRSCLGRVCIPDGLTEAGILNLVPQILDLVLRDRLLVQTLCSLHHFRYQLQVDPEEAVEGGVEIRQHIEQHGHREDGELTHGELHQAGAGVYQHHPKQADVSQDLQKHPPGAI